MLASLEPCAGLRPWQLLGVGTQVALVSSYVGSGAGSNWGPDIGSSLAGQRAPLPL